MSTTVTYRFFPVKVPARRRVTCPRCGKRRTVQRTFEQTINPWNKAVKALPPDATYHDAYEAVRESVKRQAAAWEPSDYESRHNACVEDS